MCGAAAVWFFRRGIAWLRALFGLHRQVVRLDALEAAVADLRRRTGVRPADLRIVGGAVWGRIGSDEEFHPFCPWCASKDSWTLLVREDERELEQRSERQQAPGQGEDGRDDAGCGETDDEPPAEVCPEGCCRWVRDGRGAEDQSE